MFPSGVLVKTGLDELILGLPKRLSVSGPSRLKVETEPVGVDPMDRPHLEVSLWSEEWCLIQTNGPDELAELVIKCLVQEDPPGEVLSCQFSPETGEYGYALYRGGRLLETFESRGPSLETVSFTSELRRVELRELLKTSDFMVESLTGFGVEPGSGPVAGSDRVRVYVDLPGPKTFWKALLGAASPK